MDRLRSGRRQHFNPTYDGVAIEQQYKRAKALPSNGDRFPQQRSHCRFPRVDSELQATLERQVWDHNRSGSALFFPRQRLTNYVLTASQPAVVLRHVPNCPTPRHLPPLRSWKSISRCVLVWNPYAHPVYALVTLIPVQIFARLTGAYLPVISTPGSIDKHTSFAPVSRQLYGSFSFVLLECHQPTVTRRVPQTVPGTFGVVHGLP